MQFDFQEDNSEISISSIISKFEKDKQNSLEKIKELEKLRDDLEAQKRQIDLKKKKLEKSKIKKIYERIENKTYADYFEKNFEKNKRKYNELRDKLICFYRSLGYDENILFSMRKKNIKDILEDFPESIYCACQKHIEGKMIYCEGPACTKEWFHVNCIDFKDTNDFYCQDCKKIDEDYERIKSKLLDYERKINLNK